MFRFIGDPALEAEFGDDNGNGEEGVPMPNDVVDNQDPTKEDDHEHAIMDAPMDDDVPVEVDEPLEHQEQGSGQEEVDEGSAPPCPLFRFRTRDDMVQGGRGDAPPSRGPLVLRSGGKGGASASSDDVRSILDTNLTKPMKNVSFSRECGAQSRREISHGRKALSLSTGSCIKMRNCAFHKG